MQSPRFVLPPLLQRDDVVRVVAPSGVFARELFERGIACLERAGLRPRFDEGLFAKDRYLAGSDARRSKELVQAIEDPDAKAIWVARGGYGATRLLPQLDVGLVQRHPRWLVGFSDTTALHALWQRAGLASMHGPNVTTVEGWGNEARRALWGWLFEGTAQTLQGKSLAGSGAVTGPLLGGNLSLLAAMAGTGALPSMAGAIVLLEDVGERPYRLDRSLTQLIQAGAFDGALGFAIGQLTDCEEPPEREASFTALGVVTDVLAELDVPILGALPIGHPPSSHPALLGAHATLDCDAGALRLAAPR